MAITIDELKRNVFPGESGGDYNALFGYANRPGGQFSGVNLTDMTVDQALQFANPSGQYGQSVKGQIGRVATPMGAYQVVGTTLRGAKEGLGLTGNEVMTPQLQDAIGMWIYRNQGPQAWEAWGGGQGGGNVTRSSKGTGMGLLDMQAQQPQTFGQKIGEGLRSGSLMDNLALAFNSLRMNPDQNLATTVGQRQEQRGEERAANRTAQWLRANGREDLATAVENNVLSGRDAAAMIYAPPESQGQVVTAEQLRSMYPGTQIEEGLYSQKPDGTITKVGGAAAPTVNVSTALPAQENAYDKGLGEWAVKTYTGVQDAAASASDQIANLGRMEVLMNDPNFRSGTGTDAVVSMQKLVEALGGNPADVGSIEAFRAASTQAVMAQLGGSLGAGFSNADRDFIMGMTANLDNSIPGNRMIIEAQKRIAQRKIELARLADEYIAKNGRLDQNWPQTMRTYAEAYPLFTSGGAGGGTGGGGGGPVLPGDMQYVNP